MSIEIRYATDQDIDFVGSHLRSIDYQELKLSYGGPPKEAVIKSADHSEWCKVALVDNEPCVLYGVVASKEKGCGVPWLVATDKISKIPKVFILRSCQQDIQEMNKQFPILFNFVHKDNSISINWLKWMGFVVTSLTNEKDFLYFYKGVQNV